MCVYEQFEGPLICQVLDRTTETSLNLMWVMESVTYRFFCMAAKLSALGLKRSSFPHATSVRGRFTLRTLKAFQCPCLIEELEEEKCLNFSQPFVKQPSKVCLIL